MKKIGLMLISLMLITGCGKVSQDKIINDFVKEVEESKSYVSESKLNIYSSEDTFTYNMKVYYMDDDYFKVEMLNTLNNHEQILLRNNEAVYVITPSLNKSYKFQSEWPYNSSQSYILSSLVDDIKKEKDIQFSSEDDYYVIKVSVNYPNNENLTYEKIYFDKKKNLKMVEVYDSSDILSIKVDFISIDYKANLQKEDFDIDNIVKIKEDDENKTSEKEDEKTNVSGSFEDIVYPLYIPVNTYLKDKEKVSTENGERVILTFNGDKNFVLIEELSNINSEFEIIPVYGEPMMLSGTVGALSENSLSWTFNNVDYYLVSDDLSPNELLTIADSMSTVNIVEK